MGYKYKEEEILGAAVDSVLNDGLSQLSFGRLAKQIGIADRSIVYYFPTKADLVSRTVYEIGGRLQTILERAFGDGRLPREELLRRAWPVLASPEADDVFQVFFELVGLGAASIAPFDELAPAIMESWIDWLVTRVDAEHDHTARSEALATVAVLDGLLLVRHTIGSEAADSAAVEIGIIGR